MPKKSALPSKSVPQDTPCRVVAVHQSVLTKLAEWEQSTGWVQAATDFRSLIELVQEGRLEAAEVEFRRLYRDAIGEGVREYGKNQKGGTLRLFAVQEYRSFFFLSAGLKKHNNEAAEAEPARKLARDIRKSGRQTSKRDYEQALGGAFVVSEVPTHSSTQRGKR